MNYSRKLRLLIAFILSAALTSTVMAQDYSDQATDQTTREPEIPAGTTTVEPVQEPEPVKKPKNALSKWFDETSITTSVKAKLLSDNNVKGLKINVDTKEDVVVLSGEVESAEERQLAERLARDTNGVKEVLNNLVVVKANS
ncbi:MAG: BON domain-containing protein [Pseudomonadales bacterium]|nr:BON domain-containing protein [Pseudomonadales bacterium]